MTNLYETLGLHPGATSEEIKLAYRNKAKECHPDVGGDPEVFKLLSMAYKILSDEEKRRRYDAGEDPTGMFTKVLDEEKMALNVLLDLFGQIVSMHEIEHIDVVKIMREQIMKQHSSFEAQIHAEKKKIQRFEKAMKRIKSSGEENIFSASCQFHISGANSNIEKHEVNKRIAASALKMLESYSYETMEQFVQIMFQGGNITFTQGI